MESLTLAAAAARRSAVYWTLSELYLTCPDADFVTHLQQLLQADYSAFGSFSCELAAAAGAALPEDARGIENLAVEYTRLFCAVSPKYGLAPPYESVHRGSITAELTTAVGQFYSDVGLMPVESAVPADHLGIELKFLALLCHEEGEAWQAGNLESALILARDERKFLSDHLTPWVPQYAATLQREARHPLYKALASLTEQTVMEHYQLFRVSDQ